MLQRDVFAALRERWADRQGLDDDPVLWSRQRLREHLWSAQREIALSVRDNRYTAVHSAHDMGKSKIASNIMAWWIERYPPGEAFVISTAPSSAQVSSVLWREVGKNHSKGSLVGTITRAGYPKWHIGNELVGYGRKPADYSDSAFQGIHARYVLVVIDEAGGVQKNLYVAADALATNENARILAIGNPDDPAAYFHDVCQPGSGWNVIHLDALRSPNFTKEEIIGRKSLGFGYENPRYPMTWAFMRSEGIPFSREEVPADLRPMLVSPLWVEERIQRYAGVSPEALRAMSPAEQEEEVSRKCAQSSLVQAKVRGIFPTAKSEGVIPLGWVEQAMARWRDIQEEAAAHPEKPVSAFSRRPGVKSLGVDVAREGEDETAIATRFGSFVVSVERMRVADTMVLADEVAARLDEPRSNAVIDTIGIGAGVFDSVRRKKANNETIGVPIAFNAAAHTDWRDVTGSLKFQTQRSAAWWKLREMLDPAGPHRVALPDDEQLKAELCAPKFRELAGGIIQVEPKEQIKKRLGRSTDSADAVIQTFWVDGSAGESFEVFPWRSTHASPADGVSRYDGYETFADSGLFAGVGATSAEQGWEQGGGAGWLGARSW